MDLRPRGLILTLRTDILLRNPALIFSGDASCFETTRNGPTQSLCPPCTRKYKAGTPPAVSVGLKLYFTSTHGPSPTFGVLKSSPTSRNSTRQLAFLMGAW